MSKYVDLVTCKQEHGIWLFYAPAFSYLHEGQELVVDTQCGEQPATVISAYTVEKDSDLYNFIIKATGATLPLKKVLSKVNYKKLEYEEETDGTDNNQG